jgi:hypothetical protein
MPASAISVQGAIAPPPGLRAATWQLDGGTTNAQPSCIGRLQRPSRTFDSDEGGEDLTKARFMYLLLIASLFAYMLGCLRGIGGFGMSDGGGFF